MNKHELHTLQYHENRGEFSLERDMAFDKHLAKLQHVKDNFGLMQTGRQGGEFSKLPYWYGFKTKALINEGNIKTFYRQE